MAVGSYWEYVKAFNFEKCRILWHTNFVGWPYVSVTPVEKRDITDWITQFQAKGLHLESFDVQPVESLVKGNIVVTYYWVTARWVDKDGHGDPSTTRITHTWIKDGAKWQIIGGMSALAEADNR